MREIKLKVYDKINNRMATELYNIDFFNKEVHINHDGGFDNDFFNEEVHINNIGDFDIVDFKDIELMQFTGFTDKNGVEIYEQDYIELFNNIWLVVWENDRYILRHRNITRPFFMDIEQSIVIGNIFENKELLEV